MGTLILIKGRNGIIGRCDKRCYNAKHPDCECCCGGRNHGVGIQKALENTKEMMEEKILNIGKESEVSFPLDVQKQNSFFSKTEENMPIHILQGEWESRRVWLDGEELLPGESQKIYNHSPDGFNWGYGGSGPAQLALAICLALKLKMHYQDFKWKFIAQLPQSDFHIEFDPMKETFKNIGP